MFFFCNRCNAPWNNEWHSVFGQLYGASSQTLVLCIYRIINQSSSTNVLKQKRNPIIERILSMTHRKWFDPENVKETLKTMSADAKNGGNGSKTDDTKTDDGTGNPFEEEKKEEEKKEEEKKKEKNTCPPLVDYFGNVIPETKDAGTTEEEDKKKSNNINDNENANENESMNEIKSNRIYEADYGNHIDDASISCLEQLRTLNGPYVYELFSIIIHVGTVTSGHYYAYIKNFKDRKWYKFNDTVVTPINDSNIIAAAFGGDQTVSSSSTAKDKDWYSRSYGGGYNTRSSAASTQKSYTYKSTNSANAYQVTYRRYEPKRNESFVTKKEKKKEKDEKEEKDEKDEKEEKEEKDENQQNEYFPEHLIKQMKEMEIEIKKEKKKGELIFCFRN